jgi:hypothetical protein
VDGVLGHVILVVEDAEVLRSAGQDFSFLLLAAP